MIRAAILWESYGPYHFARVNALRKLTGQWVALELSSINSTYEWQVNDRNQNELISIFSGSAAGDMHLGVLFRRIRKVLLDKKINVFFAPSYWPAYSLVAVLAAKSLGIRIVFMGDSHYASGRNKGVALVIKRLLIRLYDSALVAGSLHRSFLKYLGMPSDKIFDGYDTVDNFYFEKIADMARSNAIRYCRDFDLPKKYILSLGRFVSKKNLESVLIAYSNVVKQAAHADHDLVFVGSGSMRVELLRLARARDMLVVEHDPNVKFDSAVQCGSMTSSGRVHFYPFAQIEKVPVYYALATVYILASTTEEWGLVVNEAMACSCPVMVSKAVGSAPDLVVDGITGYSFDPRDIVQIEQIMKLFCNDLMMASRIGRNANEHIGAWSNDRFAANALAAAECALGDASSAMINAVI